MPGHEADSRFRKLAADVKAIHQDLHNIELFHLGATVDGNELRVLRRWNSHTPMLQFSYGGGYLLRWQDKGTVIDPGVTFLDIGSRYLDGKVTVVNWPLDRLILSYSANLYSRIITGLPVHDATGGFKCFRRRALEAVRLDRVASDGYAFQIEMSFKCWKKGFRIREIPIVFTDRRAGVSKMNRRIIWEAAGLVWRLRLMSILGRIE